MVLVSAGGMAETLYFIQKVSVFSSREGLFLLLLHFPLNSDQN